MACDVVWSEVSSLVPIRWKLRNLPSRLLDIRFAALDPEVALAAGQVFRSVSDGREAARTYALPTS